MEGEGVDHRENSGKSPYATLVLALGIFLFWAGAHSDHRGKGRQARTDRSVILAAALAARSPPAAGGFFFGPQVSKKVYKRLSCWAEKLAFQWLSQKPVGCREAHGWGVAGCSRMSHDASRNLKKAL